MHLCLSVWRERQGWEGSVHSDEARSQCLLFTYGPFTGPDLPPAPPSQFSFIPSRIPLSSASGTGGRESEEGGREARLSTTNVFFRNRVLLVWLPMKTTPAFLVWTNCPVLSRRAEDWCRGEKDLQIWAAVWYGSGDVYDMQISLDYIASTTEVSNKSQAGEFLKVWNRCWHLRSLIWPWFIDSKHEINDQCEQK